MEMHIGRNYYKKSRSSRICILRLNHFALKLQDYLDKVPINMVHGNIHLTKCTGDGLKKVTGWKDLYFKTILVPMYLINIIIIEQMLYKTLLQHVLYHVYLRKKKVFRSNITYMYINYAHFK